MPARSMPGERWRHQRICDFSSDSLDLVLIWLV
jgi:hypothetical protein